MSLTEEINSILKSIKASETEVLSDIASSLKNFTGKKIIYFNQNSFNEFHKNSEFRQALLNNFEIFSDGIGMSFALRFLFRKKVDKFNATDLYTKVFYRLFEDTIPVYVIGGNYDLISLTEKSRQKIILAGYSNGYDDIENQALLVQKILQSKARIIGIGMGTPRQEILASQISFKLENCVILCVGNFFNFYFGITKRAPAYLRNSGFEWIYRLFSEPVKLWKRYIIGIPVFLFRILWYKLL